MKTLYLIRHAKSSWDSSVLNDFDRTLNDRGKRDAPVMAERLLNKGLPIDAFISSTAVRALTTAQFFAAAYGFKENEIISIPSLYHASPATLLSVIETINDTLNSVAIFTHNPGITNFVNMLTQVTIDNVPTCGVFATQIHTNKWAQFNTAKKEFLFFDYPKALH